MDGVDERVANAADASDDALEQNKEHHLRDSECRRSPLAPGKDFAVDNNGRRWKASQCTVTLRENDKVRKGGGMKEEEEEVEEEEEDLFIIMLI